MGSLVLTDMLTSVIDIYRNNRYTKLSHMLKCHSLTFHCVFIFKLNQNIGHLMYHSAGKLFSRWKQNMLPLVPFI